MTNNAMLPPILVADDNPTDVFFLERRLAVAGILHPLKHVEDGMEAVRWIQRRIGDRADPPMPWLMFVDLKMPRMDGFEVLGWLRHCRIMEYTTVCVLSTSDEPADRERAAALGAHRYLVKYPQPHDLWSVADLATGRCARSPLAPGEITLPDSR